MDKEGILAAVKLLLKEPNTLFDDMTKKLLDYPQLKEMLQNILFSGIDFPFKRETPIVNLGVTFGFLKDKNGIVAVANRIFETQFYDMFLAEMAVNNKMYMETASNRNQFIVSGMLQMDLETIISKQERETTDVQILSLTIKGGSLLLSLKSGGD